MDPGMQTKLLRFLQNLTFQKVGINKVEKANVRLVCATNRDPLEEIRLGRLRQDLYYRLHVIPIHMPPLRVRQTDIVDLAEYFLLTYAREERKSFLSFTPEAEERLIAYDWPGNVRQLQNIIRNIVVMHDGSNVTVPMLPAPLAPVSTSLYSLDNRGTQGESEADNETAKEKKMRPLWRIEKQAIEEAIALCEGNIPRAAALLEISPSTIYRKKMSWDKGETSSYF